MALAKLMLAIFAGGPVLGIAAGLAVDPTIKEPPEPWWRGKLEKRYVPVEPYRLVEAPPQDLTPLRWPAGHVPARYHEAASQPIPAPADAAYVKAEPPPADSAAAQPVLPAIPEAEPATPLVLEIVVPEATAESPAPEPPAEPVVTL